MKRLLSIISLIAAMLLLPAFLISCGEEEKEEAVETSTSAFPQQTSQSGTAGVSVVPENISADAGTWKFKIVIDSEASLDEDLAESVVLVDDTGAESKPTGFEGDPPGGNHREGVLEFNAIKPQPKSVTLKVRGVGGVGERSFSWTLGP